MSNDNIVYDINIKIVNIINNVIKKQTPELVKSLSVRENLNENSLKKCIERFNEDYDISKCEG
jgi:hypothetical protein